MKKLLFNITLSILAGVFSFGLIAPTPAGAGPGGQPVTLSWSGSGIADCTASGGWSGTKEASGSESKNASLGSSFTITCTTTDGSPPVSSTKTINSCSASPPPLPET